MRRYGEQKQETYSLYQGDLVIKEIGYKAPNQEYELNTWYYTYKQGEDNDRWGYYDEEDQKGKNEEENFTTFYLEKIEKRKGDYSESLYGILQGQAKNMENKMVQKWVKMGLYKGSLFKIMEISDKIKNQLQQQTQVIQNLQFFKIGQDHGEHYGDGGYSYIQTPLYFCEELNLEKEKRDRLKLLLNEMGDKTQDFHETCPVQDIIDPELMPNYCIDNDKQKQYYYDDNKDIKDDYADLRSQYQWIPTKFKVYKDFSVEILGQIHNLPLQNNEEIYELLAYSFQKMLPGYKELDILNFENQYFCILQVIVKVQKYILSPGQTYSGKWHLEGKTENIVAAGVYYISIDQGFGKDELQFRLSRAPDTGRPYQYDIQVKDGCSVVFKNCLPHKFDTLSNTTDKNLERLFMNFFVIDPKRPIQDQDQINQIQEAVQVKTNSNLSKYIMEYLGYGCDLQRGKEMRRIMRENSHKQISGWGFIHYGNSGNVGFVDSEYQKCVYDYFKEKLRNE